MKRNRIKVIILPEDKFNGLFRSLKDAHQIGGDGEFCAMLIIAPSDGTSTATQIRAIGARMGAQECTAEKSKSAHEQKPEDFGERLRRFCGGFGG